MDLSNIMQMANQLREQFARNQAEAAKTRVTGEAGGGMVRVVLNGRYEALEVVVDPQLLASGDRALLEDLLRAAFNQASSRVAEDLRQRMGSFAQGLGVDLSALGMFDDDKR